MKTYTNDPTVKRAALAAFPGYSGRKFAVSAFPDHGMSLESNWGGGSRNYFVLLNLSTLAVMPIPQNGTSFDGRGSGGLLLSALPAGAALVEETVYCGKNLGLTVYVNATDLAPLLPAPTDLTWAEKVTLRVTNDLKSFARWDSAREETGIESVDYELAKRGLTAKGLLSRAGGITPEGRNAAGALPRLEDLDKPENGGKDLDRWGIRRNAAKEIAP